MRDSRRDLWAVVLAGGAGDSPAPLRHTLDRVTRLIPPSQTLVVTHAAHVAGEVAGYPAITVLAQPCDRGTAAGVLLAAHWIRARAPGAVAAVFPTNHLVLAESVPMSHVAAAGEYVRDHPEWLLLLGVHPTEPGFDGAWIEPGEPVGWTGRGAVHRIRALHEKPPADLARRLHGRALCNTFAFTATVTALVEAGSRACRCFTTGSRASTCSRARGTRLWRSSRPTSSRPPRTSPARSSRRPRSRWPSWRFRR